MESGFVCSPILMKGDIKLSKKTENKILVKEIERLKKENGTLMYKLELANESKNEYDMLIQELKEQRDKYKKTYKNFEKLGAEFEKEKNKLLKNHKNYDVEL